MHTLKYYSNKIFKAKLLRKKLVVKIHLLWDTLASLLQNRTDLKDKNKTAIIYNVNTNLAKIYIQIYNLEMIQLFIFL